jgi:hypothetical protein
MEQWDVGVLECWEEERKQPIQIVKKSFKSIIPLRHYPIIPSGA